MAAHSCLAELEHRKDYRDINAPMAFPSPLIPICPH